MKKNKVVLYIAMSLDGYIARPDGSVDWLNDIEMDGGDGGYGEFYRTVGTIVMGRLTYDEVLKLADDFPYADKPCYVLSRTTQPPAPHVTFTDETLETLIPRLKAGSEGDVWLVGGGQLVTAFLEAKLLDELCITIIPKVLGDGIPLFPQGTVPSTFRLMQMQKIGQMVSLSYSANGQ
ncbi:dihydrofolate reductase family protein [Paenibacillus sp. ACRRX]|uniref:dihydrofolate reductase family protein n=1 Tax=Paenibacillus sp. ACRRX TaxID=2918206 RepID=UPI001EF48440|nr:dihydrofolate reductase family protein [Paenibacillus sp. ACRRX]MCG7409211.1 dihydrofolate reductase family protein [Paenibacillus sp. ACRRX]